MALGAQRSAVVWMVLRRVLLLAAVGLAISVPAALVASRLVCSRPSPMIPEPWHWRPSEGLWTRINMQSDRLTAIIEREGEGFVPLCPELDIASQGSSIEKREQIW
jgi:hypothetical protein